MISVIQLIFVSKKLEQDLKPKKKIKPSIVSQQCVVHKFACDLCDADYREFKIRRLRTTTRVKHATAHDQNHVTLHFSRVVQPCVTKTLLTNFNRLDCFLQVLIKLNNM